MEGRMKNAVGNSAHRLERLLPLLDRVVSLWRGLVSLFISNLSPETSRVELESMFWRVGKILDTFIPVDRKIGKKRGIAFVRFKTKQEAFRAISLGQGQSWGGRKISMPLARPLASGFRQRLEDPPRLPIALRKHNRASDVVLAWGDLARKSAAFLPR